jgi:EpsD family peptidyl-prolyl cis-trans isomerase
MISKITLSRPATIAVRASILAVAASSVLLAGCGKKDEKKDKVASQTAARVNKEEITVHQINFLLSQQRGLAPEQAASASKVALERIIDQELTVQKAAEQKLDRDPRVVAQIEAARREIISRAYLEKIGAGAPKPSPEEIKQYYEAHPNLFRDRKVYAMQEIAIQATPEQMDELRNRLQAAKDINEFVAYLKSANFKFAGNQVTKPAEQIPLAHLDNVAKMKEGQAIFNPAPQGAQVVFIAAIRPQPVDEERARPAIEQFLLNERKRKVIDDDLKALRSSAKIEYVGDYVRTDSPVAKPSPTEVKPSTSPLVSAPASAVEPIIPVQPASMPTGNTLEKGIKGLK